MKEFNSLSKEEKVFLGVNMIFETRTILFISYKKFIGVYENTTKIKKNAKVTKG